MNNKPVAWMLKLRLHPTDMALSFDKPSKELYPDAIPLYTHSVKELTDEEIEQCWKQTVKQEFISKVYRFDFARAILRKAQEK